MKKAQKFHICEMCGCEIHPNEYYYSYKCQPVKINSKQTFFDTWRCRCINHKPGNQLETAVSDGHGNYWEYPI